MIETKHHTTHMEIYRRRVFFFFFLGGGGGGRGGGGVCVVSSTFMKAWEIKEGTWKKNEWE